MKVATRISVIPIAPPSTPKVPVAARVGLKMIDKTIATVNLLIIAGGNGCSTYIRPIGAAGAGLIIYLNYCACVMTLDFQFHSAVYTVHSANIHDLYI